MTKKRLSPLACSALEALGTFHYLCPSQLHRAGVGASPRTAREKALAPLSKGKRPLVHCEPFGFIPGRGRLESVYQLTRRGAETLAELLRCDVSEIRYPRSALKFQRDYEHRRGLIDTHIALRNWVNASELRQIEVFDPYYFRPGKRPLTQFQFRPDPSLPTGYAKVIKPDAICLVSDGDRSLMLAIELHMATDTRRVAQQLDRHITALAQNLIAPRYRFGRPHVVLSVHRNQTTLIKVMEWFKANPEANAFMSYFRFVTYERFIEPSFDMGRHLFKDIEI